MNEMLDYFYNIIDSIYKSYNIAVNPKLTEYISYKQAMPFQSKKHITKYKFWCSLTEFIPLYLAKNNHTIFDIIGVIFYTSNRRLCIQGSLKNYLINATSDQIQKLAESKNLYRLLCIKRHPRYIDFGNIESINNLSRTYALTKPL
jgi:hypothetical protein